MPASKPGQSRDLLYEFEDIRAQQLDLCQSIEAFADSLGGSPDWQVCTRIVSVLAPLIERAHAFDDTQLLPFLSTLSSTDPTLVHTIEQLKRQHLEDMDVANEVCEVLGDYSTGNLRLSPDAIGYLLRGFFVSLRRHLAYKGEVLDAALRR